MIDLPFALHKWFKGDPEAVNLILILHSIVETWDDLKDQIGGAYGEKVILGSEGVPFTLDAAIEALTVADDGSEQWIANDNEAQPGTARGLLQNLAMLKGEPFDESRFDEDGYLKDRADTTPLAA